MTNFGPNQKRVENCALGGILLHLNLQSALFHYSFHHTPPSYVLERESPKYPLIMLILLDKIEKPDVVALKVERDCPLTIPTDTEEERIVFSSFFKTEISKQNIDFLRIGKDMLAYISKPLSYPKYSVD